MKKLFFLALTIVLAAAAANAAVTVSPKLGYWTGGVSSAIGYGCQISSPLNDEYSGAGDMGLVSGNGYTLMSISVNGVRRFAPVTKLGIKPYAGIGLIYDMLNISTLQPVGGSVAGAGMQIIGGLELGDAFVQLKYLFSSLNYTYSIAGVGFSSQYNGGMAIETGYKFEI